MGVSWGFRTRYQEISRTLQRGPRGFQGVFKGGAFKGVFQGVSSDSRGTQGHYGDISGVLRGTSRGQGVP